MAAARTPRDARRRSLSQNVLADDGVVDRLLPSLDLTPDELVVEFGPGRGALTLPLARAGVRVMAFERDRDWADGLRDRVRRERVADRVRVITTDLRRARLPREPYRVVANLPFAVTTDALGKLLDDPEAGPWRADLLVQWEVAVKRAASPPTSLRSAAWAPWWDLRLGDRVPRRAFRPVPAVDGGWLHVTRRAEPVLPTWLADGFAEVLRDAWQPPQPKR